MHLKRSSSLSTPKQATASHCGLSTMQRMYCVANWFDMTDQAWEELLYDTPVFIEFCGVDLGKEGVPDTTTLLNFRHLLEQHDLGAAIFAKVGELLLANCLKLCGRTIVDVTIIAALSSTKNQDKARNPEMHSTQEAGHWHFGMKAHIGVNSASVTAANEHDSQQLGHLPHGGETRLYGDSAYRGQQETLKAKAPKAKDFTNKRAYRNMPLTENDKQVHRTKSQTRAKVEYPFLTLKRIWGFAKVRCWGLAKNANRTFVMLALINIERWERPLMA
jgi:transposase, IS5 family